MKRILYLSRGGLVNGSQRQLYYIVSNLNRNIYEPIVACRKDGQLVGQLREFGIELEVFELRPWRKFPGGLSRYFHAECLAAYARQHKVDIVHSSDLWLNNYLLWVARRLKIPSILHVRTPIRPSDVHKHKCKKATHIVAISRRIRQNLLAAGISPEKITLIDDSVDLETFSPKQLKVNVLRRDFSLIGKVLVGIVGRIDPSKRQLEFLEAAEQILRDSKKEAVFFVIGEVHSQNYFKKLKGFVSKHKLGQCVFFTGRRNDMAEVLSSLDIVVSLSGGSIMFEAMACGKSVISAGFSSKEDSVHIQDGQTGLLVSSRDSHELAEAIGRLIGSPELRRQIGQQARKWAEEKLSHLELVDKTQQLYKQLLQG